MPEQIDKATKTLILAKLAEKPEILDRLRKAIENEEPED